MIGTMLGNRYELLEKIGEGGMAEVYKAKCHLLNRFVAVKILKSQFTDDNEFVEKFKKEATAAASLSNTNIVNIYDVGSDKGINYIVMEYVDGKTLKQIIKEEIRLDYYKTIDIAIQIAKALDCAHSNNLIHRDIKPHNILVTKDNIVKVTDFGIAKVSDSATITNTSTVMGSAHYFSPEQARGANVDFRTDLYSFGVVMYEMVTGRVPYDAESPVSVALKHIQEEVIPPKKLIPSIPTSLNDLIIKAMAKDPANRYQNAKDMLYDLNKIKDDPDYSIIKNDNDDDDDNDKTRIMNAVDYEKLNKNPAADKDVNNAPDENNVADENNDGEDNTKKNGISKKKKTIAIVSGVIALLVIVGFVAFFIANNKVSGNEITVPKIIGKTQEEAKKAVEDSKLKFLVIGKKPSDKPKGTVIECYPEEGTKVKANFTIRVSISSGKEELTVPDLSEMTQDLAKETLTYYGLKLGNVSEAYDDNVEKGLVISQDPTKDTTIAEGSSVDIVISKGPKNGVTVPKITGSNIDNARSILSSYGLELGSASPVDTNNQSQDGIIINQDPQPGTQVTKGSKVNVTFYSRSGTGH